MTGLSPGRATAAGTAAWCRRHASRVDPGHFRRFGGLTVSSLGLGTYLGADDRATDALYGAAVVRALEVGINVLDTAINYRGTRSERVVRQSLRDALERGIVRRDEVVVATKGGFVPASTYPVAYFQQTYVATGLALPSDLVMGCHCLAVGYLEDQVARSRENLGLETLDVYYLHNPEMQLAEVPRARFFERLRAAFEMLERACDRGEVGVYGVSTWSGLRAQRGSQDHLSLADLVAIARELAGNGHHFRVVELPYNLEMTEAFASRTQLVDGEEVALLEAASRLGVYVMTSAPLLQGRLARDLPGGLDAVPGGYANESQAALQFVRSTPGVGTTLVGMKRFAHVEENAGTASLPPIPPSLVRGMFR